MFFPYVELPRQQVWQSSSNTTNTTNMSTSKSRKARSFLAAGAVNTTADQKIKKLTTPKILLLSR